MGRGVQSAGKLYESAGVKDVEVILYPEMRHEILNEPGNMAVFSDIESWLTNHAILRVIKTQNASDNSVSSER